MRTITRNVYRFDELNEKAKEKATADHFNAVGWGWNHEAMNSIQALVSAFGGKLVDWSIDWSGSSYSCATFDMPEQDEDYPAGWKEDIAERLAALGAFNPDTLKGLGDCKMTGVCFDESAIDGFRQAWFAGETDLDKLMQAAFKSWLADCQADFADAQTPDQFSQTCEANDYEFDEFGELI